jgi:hypothetical protein
MNRWRILTLCAVAAMLLAFVAWLIEHDQAQSAPAGSVDRHGDHGLALAMAYLTARGVEAAPTFRPLAPGTVPDHAVVLRLTPARATAAHGLGAAERAWISGGGRLVLAEEGVREDHAATSICLPLWPGVKDLAPRVAARLDAPHGAVVVRAGTGAMITCERIGSGELVRLTCGDCLTDERLGDADHLALLQGLADLGSGRAVRFDEYALGRGSLSLGELLRRIGLAPVALLALLAAGCWAWRRAVTNGSADGPPPERREDAIELVDSLGELLGEHLDDRTLLDAYAERLHALVARRSGLRGVELTQRLATLLGPTPPANATFRHRLDLLNAAFERAHHERPG